ncbi:MAG: 50S ribosomal protein L3 [Acidobacteria bacterium]|nr:MAG: 50S ribosomal protein L3 [Acidobacteriota bacterium]PYV02841.1 MAG: 50S ribosomal protein L3 [Acidobacteriota bacterium]PYV36171.1 MAG: 50S ribosomal protein L3 [Acidobacteriota bacterium]
MVDGLIGIKVGMTQVFEENGTVTPVTVIKAGPCVVVQKKVKEKDGYDAVQLGLVEFVRPDRVNKPLAGRFEKAGVPPVRVLREFRFEDGSDAIKPGDQILVNQVFQVRDNVDVVGTSKGRGFAGLVKRHHFRGGAATHGSMFHRAPGSIGASAFPSRVLPGMRAAGHMGNARVTVRKLQVVRIMDQENLLLVKGAVPGRNGGYVIIRKS